MSGGMELYLHMPFCVRKCAYCDFLSFPSGAKTQRMYAKRLMEDIGVMGKRYGEIPVETIFIGGGTPSVPDSGLIVEIMEHVRHAFHVVDGAEISMEANPGTVTREKLTDYRKAGINRLSFGLQSANDRELKLLGRIHTWAEFLESFTLARECGFANLNIDLMSALPGQTCESWKETLSRVTDLDPEHISAYSLIIEEGTPFGERYGSEEGRKLLPDEDSEREMYHETKRFLKDCGYERYEISNYAKPGVPPQHRLLDRSSVSGTRTRGVLLSGRLPVHCEPGYEAVPRRKAGNVYGYRKADEEGYGRGILLCRAPDDGRGVAFRI